MLTLRISALFVIVGLALFALGGVTSAVEGDGGGKDDPPEQVPPPPVISGTAKMNSEWIIEAGQSPHHCVLRDGEWWHQPGYRGPDGARMSSI